MKAAVSTYNDNKPRVPTARAAYNLIELPRNRKPAKSIERIILETYAKQFGPSHVQDVVDFRETEDF